MDRLQLLPPGSYSGPRPNSLSSLTGYVCCCQANLLIPFHNGLTVSRMPAKHVPTSLAVARFLKEQRTRLGYTLRDVEEMSTKSGNIIPFSTLARIEQGVFDPGLPRLQQLLQVYQVPMQAAGDLLDLEQMAGELPAEKDPKRLYKRAHKAALEGDSRAALAGFMALKQIDAGENPLAKQSALLALSSVAATLGKFQFAKHVIDGLLVEPPHPKIMPSVLAQASRCWYSLGGAEVATALIDRAESLLDESTPQHQIAFVFHQKALVLIDRREFRASHVALDKALAAYRAHPDHAGYCRALAVRIRIAFGQGRPAEALAAARTAQTYARRHKMARLRLLYTIDVARAHLACGRAAECLSKLTQVLAEAISTGDAVVRFRLHYYFWRAYQVLGDDALARAELDRAASHLEFIDAITPEAEDVRAALSGARRPGGRPARARRRR